MNLIERLYRYWIVEPLAATPGGFITCLAVGGALLAVQIATGSAVEALALAVFVVTTLVTFIRLIL